MKAWLLRAPAPLETGPLEFADVAPPEPGPGQVLVRVSACAVCRTDLHVVEGELPPRKTPLIPGHQVVGTVARDACGFRSGERVGIAWLHRTCGECRFCLTGRENLCDRAAFTGWTVDGGYAGLALASAHFLYRIPEGFPDLHAAPLLCAGIIGYRALRLSGIQPGGRLGLYGFGAAAHVAIQVALHRGIEVYVITRHERHRVLAREMGAAWAGAAGETPPDRLDAAIIFAPAGELVPAALEAVDKGGAVALGGIHMSPIPALDYRLLYHERVVRSVASNTRRDGEEFLREAAEIPIRTRVEVFPLEEAGRALHALKHDAIRGAAVLQVG